jgi:cytochrome b subunit of formate dehydrogenase
MTPRDPAPSWQWDALLLVVAALLSLVVALVTGGLVQAQFHEPITSIISAVGAFGATLKLVWTIMCHFGQRGR